jgi:hypothetical protein
MQFFFAAPNRVKFVNKSCPGLSTGTVIQLSLFSSLCVVEEAIYNPGALTSPLA